MDPSDNRPASPHRGDRRDNPVQNPTTPPPQTRGPLEANPRANRGASSVPMSRSSLEKDEAGSETLSGDGHRRDSQFGLGVHQPLPPLPHARLAGDNGPPRRIRTADTNVSSARRSGIEWIVPVEEKVLHALSVGERLQPTLDIAHLEKDKYANKAKLTGYALNAAIGLQVILGSLTTGLSAVSATNGKSAAVQTTILGGLATVVASYLARARGSNEPELSITRVKDLEHFIRDCQAFQLDHGHEVGDHLDDKVRHFRDRFEELLGNANGERKLSPV